MIPESKISGTDNWKIFATKIGSLAYLQVQFSTNVATLPTTYYSLLDSQKLEQLHLFQDMSTVDNNIYLIAIGTDAIPRPNTYETVAMIRSAWNVALGIVFPAKPPITNYYSTILYQGGLWYRTSNNLPIPT